MAKQKVCADNKKTLARSQGFLEDLSRRNLIP
jgi:hypothetical protein